jgi:hypothetical protein
VSKPAQSSTLMTVYALISVMSLTVRTLETHTPISTTRLMLQTEYRLLMESNIVLETANLILMKTPIRKSTSTYPHRTHKDTAQRNVSLNQSQLSFTWKMANAKKSVTPTSTLKATMLVSVVAQEQRSSTIPI